MSLSHQTLSDIQSFLAPPCTWPPSAARAVKELLAEYDRLTGEVCELKRVLDALRGLMDEQNGPPLASRLKQWQAAYDRAVEILKRNNA